MSTSHHLIVESLTTSNLQKHTTNAHETPRTKIHRYFNQAEDPRILSHREHTPTQHPASDAWDPTKDFLRSTRLDTKLTAVGDYQSPILGYKERPQSVNKMDNIVPTVLYRAFQFEENDILVHNINKHNIPQGNAVPVDIGAKRNREDDASVYSWSDSQQIDAALMVENAYVKRPRRKMKLDPVTGEVVTNPKQVKQTKKKIARQNTFEDLRPLNQFNSKLITKKRLTLKSSKSRWGVKDLEFPKLSDLGAQRNVSSGIFKTMERQSPMQKIVGSGKRQISEDDPSYALDHRETDTRDDYVYDGRQLLKENIPIGSEWGKNSAGCGFTNTKDTGEYIEVMDEKHNDDTISENDITSPSEKVAEMDKPRLNGFDTQCPINMKDASTQTVEELSNIAEESQLSNPHPTTTDEKLSRPQDTIYSRPAATSTQQMDNFNKSSQKSDEPDPFELYTKLGPEISPTSNQPPPPNPKPLKRKRKSVGSPEEPVCVFFPLAKQTTNTNPLNKDLSNRNIQSPAAKPQYHHLYPVPRSDGEVEYVSGPPAQKKRIWRHDPPRDQLLNAPPPIQPTPTGPFLSPWDLTLNRTESLFKTPSVTQQSSIAATSSNSLPGRIATAGHNGFLPTRPTLQSTPMMSRGGKSKPGTAARPTSQPIRIMQSGGDFRPRMPRLNTIQQSPMMRDEITSLEQDLKDLAELFSSSDDDNDIDDLEYLFSEQASPEDELLDDNADEADIAEPIVAPPSEKTWWTHRIRKS